MLSATSLIRPPRPDPFSVNALGLTPWYQVIGAYKNAWIGSENDWERYVHGMSAAVKVSYSLAQWLEQAGPSRCKPPQRTQELFEPFLPGLRLTILCFW